MSAFFRHAASLALALAATWWFLLSAPAPALSPPAPEPPVRIEMPTRAFATAPPVAADPAPEVERSEDSEPPAVAEEEGSAPPPPEAGTREGEPEGDIPRQPDESDEREEPEPADDPLPDEDTDPGDPTRDEPREAEAHRAPAEALAEDEVLLDVARKELSGEAKYGFRTSFRSRPEDQLAIARAFDEPVVLVPRAALGDDTAARSYELDLDRARPRVKAVRGRPPLERYRQYRDLFSFEFARLPEAVRDLRTSVVRRDEVYLFAALIPVSEWAVVVGRRREVLERLSLDEDDVEEFVMTYVRGSNGSFDIAVDSLELTNGKTIRNTP